MDEPKKSVKLMSREAFRGELHERVGKGAITEAAQHPEFKVTKKTAYMWWAPGYSTLPDCHQIQIIAQIKGVDPCWLAFGKRCDELSTQEATMLDVYRRVPPLQQQNITTMMQAMLPAASGEQPIKESSEPMAKAKKPKPTNSGDAWEMVKGMKLKSKDIDVSSIAPPPATHQLPTETDTRKAANFEAVGDGTPYIAETAPADVKYDRKNHFITKFVGRSMSPTMMEGDRLIVEKFNLLLPTFDENRGAVDPKPWLALDGEVVVAAIDDEQLETVIKRIEVQHRKKTGFRIVLRSDNPKVKSIEVHSEDRLRIVGIVREIIRSPKNIA